MRKWALFLTFLSIVALFLDGCTGTRGKMKLRFLINHAPDTDVMSRPDLFLEIRILKKGSKGWMRGTGLRTDYVSDSWDPEFKEIINYEFFDDTPERIEFMVFEKEPVWSSDKKLGGVTIDTEQLARNDHVTVPIHLLDSKGAIDEKKFLTNGKVNVTLTAYVDFNGGVKDAKLKAYKEPGMYLSFYYYV